MGIQSEPVGKQTLKELRQVLFCEFARILSLCFNVIVLSVQPGRATNELKTKYVVCVSDERFKGRVNDLESSAGQQADVGVWAPAAVLPNRCNLEWRLSIGLTA